jgi:hypothetical protein
MRKLIKNKRGFSGMLFFIIALLVIIILGVIGAIIVGLFDYAGDNIVPVFQEIGVIGDTNISAAAGYTITPLNTFVQALPWIIGFAYMAMLIFSMIFVVTYEANPHPALIGAYIFLVILVIFGAIILSNVYEDIYTGTDELALRLKEQTTLSYMILYSPTVMAIISIFTGIYLFARPHEGGGI